MSCVFIDNWERVTFLMATWAESYVFIDNLENAFFKRLANIKEVHCQYEQEAVTA